VVAEVLVALEAMLDQTQPEMVVLEYHHPLLVR
jgi:hypothetical protein